MNTLGNAKDPYARPLVPNHWSPAWCNATAPLVITYPLIDIDLGIGRQWGYDCYTRRVRVYDQYHPRAAHCHPNRPAMAHKMCRACYEGWRVRGKRLRREITAQPVRTRLVGSTHGTQEVASRAA